MANFDNSKTFLFLSLPRHDGQYSSTPWQMAVEIAKTNRVIFIDHPYTIVEMLSNRKSNAIKKRIAGYAGSKYYVKDGVHVVHSPFVLPVNFLPKGKLYNLLSGWNQRLLANRINAVITELKIKELIFVNSFNFYFADLHKYLRLKKSLNVYHCLDPMVKPFTLKHGTYLEQRAARTADITVSTAPALQQKFLEKGIAKSFMVPNAANYDLFAQASNGIDVHPLLKQIKGNVIGYFGNIERRINYSLLEEVINALPDWTLVLAGPIDASYIPKSILDHPRIYFPGAFRLEEAPSVVKRFDVAIIPFICDEVSNSIYPLKLHEYLSAGKPVVSTNFNPEVLNGIKPHIKVADNAKDFASAVLDARTNNGAAEIQLRQEFAQQHSWTNRVKDFLTIIENQEREKLTISAGRQKAKSLKEKIKSNPKLKQLVLKVLFRPKPHSSRVRWFIWLFLILPKYFRQAVSWSSRLDLVPFNAFKLGKYSRIEKGVVINNGMGDVIIHDEVHTGIGCIIIGPVTLHKHVGLSQYVRIIGMHHGSEPTSPHHHQPSTKAPVILEEDAFIGTGTVIMGKKNGEPLTLGKYCRVGANSVVTTDIPPYSVAVGNPARVVRIWDFEQNKWVKPTITAAQNRNYEVAQAG